MAETTQLYSGTQTFESDFVGEKSVLTVSGLVPKLWNVRTTATYSDDRNAIGHFSSLKIRVKAISQKAVREYLIDAQRGNVFTILAESIEVIGVKQVVANSPLNNVDITASVVETSSWGPGNAVYSERVDVDMSHDFVVRVPPNAVAYSVQFYEPYVSGGDYIRVVHEGNYDGTDIDVCARLLSKSDVDWVPITAAHSLNLSASGTTAEVSCLVVFLLAL